MKFDTIYKRLTVYCLFGLLLLQGAAGTSAHGGGQPQIINQPIGEYAISVWTDPNPLQTGEVHVTVALAQEQAAALNRNVQLVVEPIGNGQTIETAVTHEKSANKFMYEADFDIQRVGEYQFTISVDDPAQTVSFAAEIVPQPNRGSRWPWVAVVIAAGAIWLVASRLKRKQNG